MKQDFWGFWGDFGDFWGDGADFHPKVGHPRWPTSVFHTGKEACQGSASLALGESRRGHDPPLLISQLPTIP